MRDSIIVLSGGLDSVTLLYHRIESIALAVTFDYGSNHSVREIECARWHTNKLGVEHLIIRLDFMKDYFTSSLLQGADSIPEGNYNEDNQKSTVVPFRNGIMLSVAAGLAETRGLHTVCIANHTGDHAVYPDCRPGFINAMGEAIKNGTYEHISLDAPFTDMTKADIVRIGAKLGIDYSHTYSCYKGGEKHCGKCGTCRERREAFEIAGVTDPTEYSICRYTDI
jgi:7-cyano-7-deazaguanine synthase